MVQEVYKSSTMGNIPLSFTGRHLLQSLREAFTEYLDAIQKPGSVQYKDWTRVSEARGRIAKYMSDLERKNNVPQDRQAVIAELRKDGYEVHLPAPWQKTRAQLEEEVQALHRERREFASVKLDPVYFQQYGRAKRPELNEYLLTYVGPHIVFGKELHKPITTSIQLEGQMTVRANNMDEALDIGIRTAGERGYALTRKDFTVQLTSVPEAKRKETFMGRSVDLIADVIAAACIVKELRNMIPWDATAPGRIQDARSKLADIAEKLAITR